MKKILPIVLIILLLVGCSSSKETSNEKTEEELRAEIKAEMEAEKKKKEELKKELEEEIRKEVEEEHKEEQNKEIKQKDSEKQEGKDKPKKITKLSDEELKNKKSEYESKFRELLGGFSGGFYTSDIKEFDYYKNNDEFKEYVDMLYDLGYGIEQAEGDYYLYVGQPVGYKDGVEAEEEAKKLAEEKAKETKKEESRSSDSNVLIESNNKNYYKYKTNTTVKFDLDGDGKDEQITYDTNKGKLMVAGYDPIDIPTTFAEKEYFIIIKFNDKYNTKMNMIGIIDYGPSSDPTTALYSIIEPRGEKWFGSVGSVGGEIIPPSKYDEDNIDDFNYKAVIREGVGIEAPVRLSVVPQTWWGRNIFTYYSTYCAVIDNINKYNRDYETKSVLTVKNDVTAYKEKDTSSDSFTIKADQQVYLLATDNKEWVAMMAEDETMGWVKVKDITENNFSGFAIFD